MRNRNEIQIRDPFVLPVPEEGVYYLYGTTDRNAWSGPGTGFDVYRSSDLERWEGPFPAFRPEEGFWANENFWAPEVHVWRGRYYMFASFKAEGQRRGTQILSAADPLGPFRPVTDRPLTPPDWECLDGTLYADRQGNPWIVFCREWLQVTDGEMYAMRLTEDLTEQAGEPFKLFSATEAPWVRSTTYEMPGREAVYGYVTDGPFLFSTAEGELWMLWSSHGDEGYAMGIAKSASGEIQGPWIQEEEPFFRRDGGHGMLFADLNGQLTLALHCPNRTPDERPIFYPVRAEGETLMLSEEAYRTISYSGG
ncbi:glycoside hydrolase family 43 protein [Cohnella fermenti]|uniref:Glycoside hydrolase n=1 Tax=Cohnella fermenti TaxID=2565925 RepID=A0A4S4BPB2_9BACL|nr:glycoside hydrolase family 43 protein [Cohnella fermenti]THF76738.1 glycoside hydrolase [Cohnella fermenti]